MGCSSSVPCHPVDSARPHYKNPKEQGGANPKFDIIYDAFSQGDANPKFDFITGALSREELCGIKSFADHHLGQDKSSTHFMSRRKAIAFVFVLQGQVYSLEQHFFVQHETYNDFSGGYRREFTKIEDKFLQKEMRGVILRFVEYNKIPDKGIMILQLQTSEVKPQMGRAGSLQSVTGQGIHTDGHEKAMLVCIQRKNVIGAENQYFADLDGKKPLSKPRILHEGDITFFKDNELYHYVCPAGPAEANDEMARTMLLLHYPAEMVLVGCENPNNTGGTRPSDIQLRDDKTQSTTLMADHEV